MTSFCSTLLVDGNDEISSLVSRAGFILDGHFCYFLMNKKIMNRLYCRLLDFREEEGESRPEKALAD